MTNSRVDILVLTAANAAQARGYVAQLRLRQQQGLLAGVGNWCVVTDPGGRRVGSGGSTLWVLRQLAGRLLKKQPQARNLAQLFAGQRILVIHSGGDSRRLCAYAAQGKVFTPLPCSVQSHAGAEAIPWQPATLMDLILANLLALPSPARGQVLLASGDVLLTFDPQAVSFEPAGVVGVAYPGTIQRARQHGVYVADGNGQVVDFLQKPDEDTARQRGAVDQVGRMLIDTGLISLDPPTVQRWLEMAGVSLRRQRLELRSGLLKDLLAGRSPAVDLYEQILMALPPALDEESYLRAVLPKSGGQRGNAAHQRHREHLTRLYRGLHGQAFKVNILPYCDFFHLGTSREMLANVSTLSRTAAQYGFAHLHRATVANRAATEGAFIYNSVLLSDKVRIGANVLLEAVDARSSVQLPGRNLVVGWPAAARTKLELPAGWGLVCLPVGGGQWSAVLFGIDDDCKTSRPNGGTLGNRPLDDFLASWTIAESELWTGLQPTEQTLWNARLWCVGTIDQVLKNTLWMCRPDAAKLPPAWRSSRRLTLSQLIRRVDHRRLIQHRLDIQRQSDLHNLAQLLKAHPNLYAQQVVDWLRDSTQAAQALRQIDQLIASDPDPLLHARLFKLSQWIVQAFPRTQRIAKVPAPAALEHAAFAAVSRSVAQSIKLPDRPRPAVILPDQVVWVTTPVRLDFTGGWSDTPPICTERGGTVLNAAITLNGQYPVQVIAKRSEEPALTLHSIDLGRSLVLRDTAAVLDHHNPHDWAALPKATLVLSGICPTSPREPLARWLKRLGGGLDITLFSALPKGSGLGTSSILGSAMLACLGAVVGEPLGNTQLIARTSLLEQLMTTGGGWQDQIGGITPGVKLIRTHPGPDQTPAIQWTSLDTMADQQWSQRTLLYFTGLKRMARNILQKVVGRYLARDPQALAIIDRLKESALQMKHDLDAGDLQAFGRGIEAYWQFKKALDPGSTNPQIEALLGPINRYLVGKVLPGAGGGGFVFMVTRDPQATRQVRQWLTRHPPNSMARFFDFQIDPKGLNVTVL